MQYNNEQNEYKPTFMEMIKQHKSILNEHLDQIKVVEHRILLNMLHATPVQSAVRHACPKKWEVEREKVAKMRDTSTTGHEETEWCIIYLTFCKVRERCVRVFIAFCSSNAVTKLNRYRNPSTDESVDSQCEAQIFPVPDADSAYGPAQIDKKELDMTPFVTHHELLNYKSMPF